ncbi:MAG TPA: hypothetical protein VGG72_16300 [Bryobacteraceae bacterium]|jgi:hypothetical protein
MQKTIYSLPALRGLLEAANRRYLEFLSAIEDPRARRNKLDKLSRQLEQEGRRYSGFNLFDSDDETLLCSIVRGEFNISGLQNKTLRHHLPELSSSQVSRLLKRLRTHGLMKKVGRTYKYYVTPFGRKWSLLLSNSGNLSSSRNSPSGSPNPDVSCRKISES